MPSAVIGTHVVASDKPRLQGSLAVLQVRCLKLTECNKLFSSYLRNKGM